MAVFIARHTVDHWWSTETASTHLRTAVDAGRQRIGVKGDTEDQLCVPAVAIQPDRYRNGEATTEGITVELVREGLWVQRGTSPDEWNCVFVPACDLYRLLNRELLDI